MRDVLGLYTADLASVMYDTANEMVPDLVSHPQQLSGHGLIWFLQGVAQTYSIMVERNVRKIQLRTDQDALEAELPGGAKTANLMTVMAASLFADKKHPVVLLTPKERSEEEVELLRRVACWVYLNYTCQAFDGLSLLCEANRHFGKIGLARFCLEPANADDIEVELEEDDPGHVETRAELGGATRLIMQIKLRAVFRRAKLTPLLG